MRITHQLRNFKAFKDTRPIGLSPVTVLCGENSSGKSSILKSILLIKQSSLERRSNIVKDAPLQPLLFNGELTRLGSWTDTVYGKERDRHIEMHWTASGVNSDLTNDIDPRFRRNVLRNMNEAFEMDLVVDFRSETTAREEISATISESIFNNSGGIIKLSRSEHSDISNKIYNIEFKNIGRVCRTTGTFSQNMGYFAFKDLGRLIENTSSTMRGGQVMVEVNGPFIASLRPVLNSSWIPFFDHVVRLIHQSRSGVPGAKPRWHGQFESQVKEFKQRVQSSPDDIPGDVKMQLLNALSIYLLHEATASYEQCKAALAPIWKRIRYLGPLRHQPQRFYQFDDTGGVDIGVSGEFTVQVLALEANNTISASGVSVTDDGKIHLEKSKDVTLLEATNYWLIHMGLPPVEPNSLRQSLYELKVGRLEVALPDVGFGVSQVLPIVVESLRATRGDTVILEQPEIHLHPRVQAALADFFLARTKDGVRFLVESHSEYFVKRMCRRIAEDTFPGVGSLVNIVFVEPTPEGSSCSPVEINEFGEVINWPKGFFDTREDLYWTQASLKRRASRVVE